MRVRMTEDIVDRLAHWFERHGATAYHGGRCESVTALSHALQCARLAEEARADAPLIVAALLHDVGHFVALDDMGDRDDIDDVHELRAVAVLVRDLPPAVIEPIRLHVAAKRYLTAVEPRYAAALSPASRHTLAQQGGPMAPAEAAGFEAMPWAAEAVRLRRWDDLAKVPGQATPPLGHYLALVEEVRITART